jgi:hypothetical protein
VSTSLGPGAYVDVAVIHHTHCGCTLLADDELRHGFAQRIGADERTLNDTPVLDPARTVATDVKRVLWDQAVPMDVRGSGHVCDVGTGLVTLVVDAKSKKQAPRRGRARLVCRVAQWPDPAQRLGEQPPAVSQPPQAHGALTPDADRLLPNTGDRTFVPEWRQ